MSTFPISDMTCSPSTGSSAPPSMTCTNGCCTGYLPTYAAQSPPCDDPKAGDDTNIRVLRDEEAPSTIGRKQEPCK